MKSFNNHFTMPSLKQKKSMELIEVKNNVLFKFNISWPLEKNVFFLCAQKGKQNKSKMNDERNKLKTYTK